MPWGLSNSGLERFTGLNQLDERHKWIPCVNISFTADGGGFIFEIIKQPEYTCFNCKGGSSSSTVYGLLPVVCLAISRAPFESS